MSKLSNILVFILVVTTLAGASERTATAFASSCVSVDASELPQNRYPSKSYPYPFPTAGYFPVGAGQNQDNATYYEVASGESVWTFILNEHAVVQNGAISYPDWDLLTGPPQEQIDAAIEVLTMWSHCTMSGEIPGLWYLLSDFGLAWTFGGADPFCVRDSPAAWLAGGSFTRSIGALPLELYGVRQMPDGRLVVLTGDGSRPNQYPRVVGNEAEGTLWILSRQGDELRVDGIVGGFLAAASEWSVIPTQLEDP